MVAEVIKDGIHLDRILEACPAKESGFTTGALVGFDNWYHWCPLTIGGLRVRLRLLS